MRPLCGLNRHTYSIVLGYVQLDVACYALSASEMTLNPPAQALTAIRTFDRLRCSNTHRLGLAGRGHWRKERSDSWRIGRDLNWGQLLNPGQKLRLDSFSSDCNGSQTLETHRSLLLMRKYVVSKAGVVRFMRLGEHLCIRRFIHMRRLFRLEGATCIETHKANMVL